MRPDERSRLLRQRFWWIIHVGCMFGSSGHNNVFCRMRGHYTFHVSTLVARLLSRVCAGKQHR